MTPFDELFVQRNASTLLEISANKSVYKSRLGGMPPAYFDAVSRDDLTSDYYYLFTLSDEFSEFIQGKDLSVFFPKNYENYGKSSIYPDLNIKCFIHEHSEPSVSNQDFIYPAIVANSLVPIDKKTGNSDEEYSYFIKIGSNPYLLQEERFFYRELEKEDYSFVLQLDENGLTSDFLHGDYPFGFGSVYFYGAIRELEKEIVTIVAGFWQK